MLSITPGCPSTESFALGSLGLTEPETVACGSVGSVKEMPWSVPSPEASSSGWLPDLVEVCAPIQ